MTAVRLATFAAIGSLAALQWAMLLADPPIFRLFVVVAVATLLGWALSRLGTRSRPPRGWSRGLAAAALIIAATLAALLVLGLPLGTLTPSGWDRLTAGVDVGLHDLGGSFDYPFDGTGAWARLLLVGAIVPLMIAAAALSFRPGRDPRRVPVAGLITLIAAFAIPALARPTAAPLLWGGLLLAFVAVWLWGERLRALPAVALVAGFGVVAIPAASGLAAGDPAVDYRSWALPGADRGISFDWKPRYGPINWPRTGQVLFRAHADRPGFWRIQVLDEFYAGGWRRSGTGGEPVPAEPAAGIWAAYEPGRTRSVWFSIRNLASRLLLSPGSPLVVDGVDVGTRDRDGTTQIDGGAPRPGASYSVTAWAPDPGVAKLRAASRRYREPLLPYTELALADDASLESIAAPERIDVPLWGHRRGAARAHRLLARSAYAGVAALAERLTAGSRSGYGAAVAIADHLRTSYAYDEQPPRRRLPLRAFLFRDRIGYCQHFSGAMALMLRMVGVPARVATGFAPGTPLADGRGFEVTDLDAHSWVEVYFSGIGWLPFDPTPPVAPATVDVRGGASFGSTRLEAGGASDGSGPHQAGRPERSAPDGGGGDGAPVPPLGLLAALTAAVLVVPPVRSLRHRRLAPAAAAEREVGELRRVLRSTGWADGESTTLLIVEDRLRRARRPQAAGYVQRFRERLYGTGPRTRLTLAERRSARRDLATGNGLRGRLRLLLTMPPGAPRR